MHTKIPAFLLSLLFIFIIGNACARASHTLHLKAGPPKPPIGKRWVLNPDFSDEFNGTVLDTSKWLDYHPSWIGREPGLFLPSQVSVKDGYLQIRGSKMEQDTVIHAYGRDLTFNIAGGAVVSKKSAYLGYYECRFKAAATSMSTTFWFSGAAQAGPRACDRYSLEWDIQECIGRVGDFQGSHFASGMHSNAHYWYTDCEGERHDYRATQITFNDDELASEGFHVYGGWWRDETSASYYYDDRAPKHQKFYDAISEQPFDKPMYMRLVSETYPSPWIELPTDEELADTTRSVVYYDWVRGYQLVDALEPNPEVSLEPALKIYEESISFDTLSLSLKNASVLNIPLSYKANQERVINLTLLDSQGSKVADATFTAFAGYAYLSYELALNQDIASASDYRLVASLNSAEAGKAKRLDVSHLIIHLHD